MIFAKLIYCESTFYNNKKGMIEVEVRLYDLKLSFANKHEEMKFITNVDKKMYKDIEFGGFVVINGENYRMCTYNIEKDILCVEPTVFNKKGKETKYSDKFVCPYCGNVKVNAWEMDDEGETECGSCCSEIQYERIVTVEYNVRPIKCAQVVRI